MLNLTSRTIMLLGAEGSADSILHPAGTTAANQVRETYLLGGERIHTGPTTVETATLQPPSAKQVKMLNLFLEQEIARDRAENGGDGMVLVDRNVLQHVDASLGSHVATPHPDALQVRHEGHLEVSMLLRPPAEAAPTSKTTETGNAER